MMTTYPADIVAPMKTELTNLGFDELLSITDVDNALNTKKNETVLVVINSVCGCAAGSMRPAVKLAMEGNIKPDRLTTSFAGFDVEAVQQARKYFLPYPPSSPCIALFKNGQLVHMIERHHIEGKTADMIAENMKVAFEEFCAK